MPSSRRLWCPKNGLVFSSNPYLALHVSNVVFMLCDVVRIGDLGPYRRNLFRMAEISSVVMGRLVKPPSHRGALHMAPTGLAPMLMSSSAMVSDGCHVWHERCFAFFSASCLARSPSHFREAKHPVLLSLHHIRLDLSLSIDPRSAQRPRP